MSGYGRRGPTVSQAFPVLSESLDPGYLRMPADDFEALLESAGLDAEDLESFGNFLRSVGNVAARVAPVALPAIGTVFGGPVGGMVGGMAGRLAGSALTGTTRTPSQAATPARMLRSAARGPAGQMLQVMSRPETSRALLSQLLGGLGRQSVPVSGQQVPVQAFSQLLGQLGLQLAAEQAEVQESLGYGEAISPVPAEDLGPWLMSLFGSVQPQAARPARSFEADDESESAWDFDEMYDAADLQDLALAGAW